MSEEVCRRVAGQTETITVTFEHLKALEEREKLMRIDRVIDKN
jgi:hypothetical protein